MDEDEARARMTNVARHRGLVRPGGTDLVAALEMRRVRDGWLGAVDHPGGDPRVRLRLADGDDVVEEWPEWPLDVIETRLVDARSDDRFPPYVAAILEDSGWFPGRHLPDDVLADFATTVAAIPQEDAPLRLHEAARSALAEFGDLALPAWRGPAIRVAPIRDHEWAAPDADLLQEMFGQPFSVVAVGRGGEYVMASDGWCVNLTTEGEYWGGVTFDDTITRAVTGRSLGTRFDHTRLPGLLAAGPLATGR